VKNVIKNSKQQPLLKNSININIDLDDDDKNRSYENTINKIVQLFYIYLPIENINEILSYLSKFRIISI
jgi:hypothetical protein